MVNARIPVSDVFSPDGDWVWGLRRRTKGGVSFPTYSSHQGYMMLMTDPS